MNTNFPSSGGSHSSGVIGNGLTVSGVYRDGPFTLKFTTGGSGRILLPNGGCIIPVYCGGYAALCPYGYIGSYFSNGSYFSSGYYAEPMYSSYSPPTTQTVSYTPAAEPAPAPVTAQDRAAAKLRFGDAKGAVAAYQAILKKEPHDAQSMRALGLSLIDAGRTGDGVAVIALAYRSDTTLAGTPVDPGAFGKSGELRSNLNRVSSYANREKSASAWLALAVLMQAEGRPRQAMAMIERAKTAGLEDQIVQEMTAALSGSEEAAAD